MKGNTIMKGTPSRLAEVLEAHQALQGSLEMGNQRQIKAAARVGRYHAAVAASRRGRNLPEGRCEFCQVDLSQVGRDR